MTRPAVDWDDEYSAPRRRWLSGRGALRWSGWGLVALVVGGLLYYAVGGFVMNVIDDDPIRATRQKTSSRSSNVAGAWYSMSNARMTNSPSSPPSGRPAPPQAANPTSSAPAANP